ncbi:FtsW/RodA/SpoVE family cell cycle protein [Haloferula rosea]|uniref:Probable peptidoglycan glycosyltransferase FtsW n=1 Tax=Haloferula rosea TaxID=490093 RepID=A0A934VDY1_9BACT|nr:FtsW/RodA/SpoVE family cell cycle protein [Haloferula rosea]MBK1825392.1 FtsW/RodA/SpoVE family cell cycle protein [Haloferula rosea]
MARYLNIALCMAVATLVVLGLVMLASTSAWVKGVEDPYYFFVRQSWMAVAGVIGAMLLAVLDPSHLRRFWPWLLLAGCLLLALCYVPGVAADLNGERRWINFPVVNRFQPSEVAKAITMIALAGWFARWQTEIPTFFKGFVVPSILLGIPLCLILFETDMGTAVGLGAAGFAVLFTAGVRLLYLVPTVLTGCTAFYFLVRSNENRWTRIEAWMNLEDPVHQMNKGLQQWRALLAFGNGGVKGQGLGNGFEKFGHMPYAHTDFIFPNIGEELGLWGTLGTVLCYVVIAVAGIGVAMYSRNVFNRCLAIGLTAVIVVPAMINIAVTTAVLPNTGLPLPFVSYGGTNLVFTLASVGLLCGIHRRSRLEVKPDRTFSIEKTYEVRL